MRVIHGIEEPVQRGVAVQDFQDVATGLGEPFDQFLHAVGVTFAYIGLKVLLGLSQFVRRPTDVTEGEGHPGANVCVVVFLDSLGHHLNRFPPGIPGNT
jgi:hypothetical protein